ncbi:hypothetical protein [Pseudonocardia humida]|uniref:Uncharacterized protein n=1 Tax=Pseudonocardia humida TaxID=2800819 RepID=A0ABT1A8E1_9PSEU|nr:hypothetical protein [Pseudonocardia humida]MCO1659196.1 hypothetical protein [Pseudonocardia humida]
MARTLSYALKSAGAMTLVLQRRDGRVEVARAVVSGAPRIAGRRALIGERRGVDIVERSSSR